MLAAVDSGSTSSSATSTGPVPGRDTLEDRSRPVNFVADVCLIESDDFLDSAVDEDILDTPEDVPSLNDDAIEGCVNSPWVGEDWLRSPIDADRGFVEASKDGFLFPPGVSKDLGVKVLGLLESSELIAVTGTDSLHSCKISK